MNHKRIYILLLLTICGISSWAAPKDSTARVTGVILDEEWPNQPIKNANVVLVSSNGEHQKTVSTFNGTFTFRKISPGTYSITASHVGYATISETLELSSGENIVYLVLKQSLETIESAVVKDSAPLITTQNDTILINPKVIPSKETDFATEFLSYIPGISFSNNGIRYKGRQVRRTYVNGRLIFGDNPGDAFRSLYANQIENIQIYEEQSPENKRRKIANGRNDLVINIKTKESITSCTDSRSFFSAGLKAYTAYEKLDLYSESLRLQGAITADNTDIASTPLIVEDPLKRGSRRYGENKLDLSAFLQKNWGDRFLGNSLVLSLGCNHTTVKSTSNQKKFLNDYCDRGNDIYIDSIIQKTITNSIGSSISLSLNGDRIKSLFIDASFGKDKGIGSTYQIRNVITESTSTYNSIITKDNTNANTNGSISINWKDDELTLFRPAISFAYSTVIPESTYSLVDTLESTLNQRILRSYKNNRINDISYNMSGERILKNDTHSTLIVRLGYDIRKYNFNCVENTLNYFPDSENPIVDIYNTHNYSFNTLKHSAHTSLSYSRNKSTLNCGIIYRNSLQIDNDLRKPNPKTTHSYPAFLPYFSFTNKRLLLKLSTDMTIPSIEQARESTNDNDQFNLIKGNPQLKPSYSTKITCNFNIPLPSELSSLSIEGNYSNTWNYIAEKQTPSQQNRSQFITSYENANGFWQTYCSAKYMHSAPLNGIVWHSNATIDYQQKPFFYKEDIFTYNTLSYKLMTGVKYRNKKLRVDVSPNYSYAVSTNSATSATSAVSNPSIYAGIAYYLLDNKIECRGEYQWNMIDYINLPVSSLSLHTLSMMAGYWAMKKKVYLSISGHNLFNLGQSESSSVSFDYTQQKMIEQFGRYYMINLKLFFNRQKR